MSTTLNIQEPCTLGLVTCGSTKLYVHTRGYAWCGGCGAKKPLPAIGVPDKLGSRPYTPEADSTGEP